MARGKKPSPTGGKKGCLCDNGTYSVECCTGELKAQGIGATTDHTISNVSNTNSVRVTSTQH